MLNIKNYNNECKNRQTNIMKNTYIQVETNRRYYSKIFIQLHCPIDRV